MPLTYRFAEDLCNSARALILAGGLNRPDMDDLCTAYLALANLRDRLADDRGTNAPTPPRLPAPARPDAGIQHEERASYP